MLDPQIKASIDEMTVEEMLRRIRYAPAGDSMFQGDAADYFYEQFRAKRARLFPGDYVAISRRVTNERVKK